MSRWYSRISPGRYIRSSTATVNGVFWGWATGHKFTRGAGCRQDVASGRGRRTIAGQTLAPDVAWCVGPGLGRLVVFPFSAIPPGAARASTRRVKAPMPSSSSRVISSRAACVPDRGRRAGHRRFGWPRRMLHADGETGAASAAIGDHRLGGQLRHPGALRRRPATRDHHQVHLHRDAPGARPRRPHRRHRLPGRPGARAVGCRRREAPGAGRTGALPGGGPERRPRPRVCRLGVELLRGRRRRARRPRGARRAPATSRRPPAGSRRTNRRNSPSTTSSPRSARSRRSSAPTTPQLLDGATRGAGRGEARLPRPHRALVFVRLRHAVRRRRHRRAGADHGDGGPEEHRRVGRRHLDVVQLGSGDRREPRCHRARRRLLEHRRPEDPACWRATRRRRIWMP